MVALAKFGSIWEGQNRVIHFLIFRTFDLRYNQILNLFSGVSNFETNCNLEERSYREDTNKLFCELAKTFDSLSEIIPEDEQQELDILQLELELYQKKFDLFYRKFE